MLEFSGLCIWDSTLNSASYHIKFAFVPICSRLFSHCSTTLYILNNCSFAKPSRGIIIFGKSTSNILSNNTKFAFLVIYSRLPILRPYNYKTILAAQRRLKFFSKNCFVFFENTPLDLKRHNLNSSREYA